MVQPLATEDYVIQAALFASPAKWNLAHTSWFFEEFILSRNVSGYKRFHPQYAFLFNSYYLGIGDRVARPERGNLSRPTVEEIIQYRHYVDEHMMEFLSKTIPPEINKLVVLGIYHEQQHQELYYTDIKYNLSVNPLHPAILDTAKVEQKNSGTSGWVKIPEGVYDTGFGGEDFCFDNELAQHKVYLHDFEINTHLVTNGEYLEFINAGGYNHFEFWHEEGWNWVQAHQIEYPVYWEKLEGDWYQYTLAGLRKINPEDILSHINYYEAAAYCQFRKLRLPTEFEWEAASDQLDWGTRWEWTESAYLPYPGYQKAEGAVGEYNGKFMVNQKVLRGASVVTPKGHSRNTYRNFFHPHINYQFSGIRLAK